MFGGAPIQMQPGFSQPFIVRNPAPASAPQPAPRAVPTGQAWPQQAPPSVAGGPQNPTRTPLIRAQMEDEASPPARAIVSRPIAIPSPEALGVSNARAVTSTDADRDALRRLQDLGADFQMRTVENGFLFGCLLPTTQPGRLHRIEAVATTRSEAVLRVLEEAEKWAGQK